MLPHSAIPINCPRCRKALYPVSTLRPQPRDSMFARLGLVTGGLIAGIILFGGVYYVRVILNVFVPVKTLIIVLMLPAVAPGDMLGLLLSRLPQVVFLRCRTFGWFERMNVPRKIAKKPLLAELLPDPTMAFVGTTRNRPERTALETDHILDASAGSAMDPIVDDGQSKADLQAWIYAEFLSGRLAEGIEAELISSGWSIDQVATLVEQGRKATRHHRP